MADKKTGKSTASHKKAVKEFQKEGNPDFQKSGGLDFQPRASAVFQEKTGASQKPGASKSHAKKEYGETFGQNVQKSGADKGQEEKAAFTKAGNTFSGQDNSGQTEENGKRQEEKEDYHRRDTYRQSQEKGKYHKKRVQREHKHREKAKDTVFTEDAGKVFSEDRASEFTGSEKLKKKQKQAQKAAEKVKKARGKLPKKREYTLQRVFDEETGKGNMWLFRWIRRSLLSRRAFLRPPCGECRLKAEISCMAKLPRTKKKTLLWKVPIKRSRRLRNCLTL